uniref:Inosine-5'-monophosphate dehydrogenase n=1 Tax=Anthurium amnicola TaxID=1678845 RepID=A0A1D1XTT3_9ARAE
MATACRGSLQRLHGTALSFPRSAHPLRNTAASAKPLGFAAGGRGALSSDVSYNARNRWEKSAWGMKRMVPASSTTDDRVELDENPEGIISGEWPENFSLLSYDDLRAYLEPQVLKDQMKPSALLGHVMSTEIRAATADQTLEQIDHHFEHVSGLPVIDSELKCIGVISKGDKANAPHGLKSMVGEVMSSPPITLTPDKTVMDAAVLMLKMKIHRIPVLNEERQVIGEARKNGNPGHYCC